MNNEELISKLIIASNTIHYASLNNNANYIVTSPEIATILNEIATSEKYKKRKQVIEKLLKSSS